MTSILRPQSPFFSSFKGLFTNNVSPPLKDFKISFFEGFFANAVSTHSRSLTLTIDPQGGFLGKDHGAGPSWTFSIAKGLLANAVSDLTPELAEPGGCEATRRGIIKRALVYNKESAAIIIIPCRPFQLFFVPLLLLLPVALLVSN